MTQNVWSGALEQLRRIPPSEFQYLAGSSRNPVRMALLVVPTYQGSKDKETVEAFSKEDAEKNHDSIVQCLSPTPNWSSMWLLHSRLQEPVSYGGRHELYPCVGLIARVENAVAP